MAEGAEAEEQRINEYIELKEISGEKTYLNILGGAKTIDIKGGYHKLKINSHVETLKVFGGYREIIVKAPIDNLIIGGGRSIIKVHNYGDAQVNNLEITGGNHDITIYSFVNELTIKGGISKVICNYTNSKINKIRTIGGQREIKLNPNTQKAILENEGGTCNIIKTEIEPEPVWYKEKLSEADIPITIVSEEHKIKESCSICLNEFQKNDKVYFLPCIHCFHVDCLRKWVKTQKNCPMCKYEFENKLGD